MSLSALSYWCILAWTLRILLLQEDSSAAVCSRNKCNCSSSLLNSGSSDSIFAEQVYYQYCDRGGGGWTLTSSRLFAREALYSSISLKKFFFAATLFSPSPTRNFNAETESLSP